VQERGRRSGGKQKNSYGSAVGGKERRKFETFEHVAKGECISTKYPNRESNMGASYGLVSRDRNTI